MTKLEAIKKIRLFLKTSKDLEKVREIALIYLDESQHLIEDNQSLYEHIEQLELIIDGI